MSPYTPGRRVIAPPAKHKDYCMRGHQMLGYNIVTEKDGKRKCRTCKNAHSRKEIGKMPAETRFWKNVDKGESCWNWRGTLSAQGYGKISVEGKSFLAHRYSFALAQGAIPGNSVICHSCDNPACVNPAHLFAGTQADNMRDMMEKGRHFRKANPATHCLYGHEYTLENTAFWAGKKTCKTCEAQRKRRYRAKNNPSYVLKPSKNAPLYPR